MPEMISTLDKINRKMPRAWEAIFFTEPNFEGDTYLAQLGNTVDFGKALKDSNYMKIIPMKASLSSYLAVQK